MMNKTLRMISSKKLRPLNIEVLHTHDRKILILRKTKTNSSLLKMNFLEVEPNLNADQEASSLQLSKKKRNRTSLL